MALLCEFYGDPGQGTVQFPLVLRIEDREMFLDSLKVIAFHGPGQGLCRPPGQDMFQIGTDQRSQRGECFLFGKAAFCKQMAALLQ